MITTKAKSRTFSLLAAQTFFLGVSFSAASIPVLSMAQDLPVQPQATMQEAPPPWGAEQGSANTTAATDAPAATNSATSVSNMGGSSVETWYRNRRKSEVSVTDELSRLQTAAKSGDAQAQYRLAMLYRTDEADKAKLKQSLEWQRKAAEAGLVEAQYGLGMLYANGQYLPKDEKKSHEWLQKAADQGHVAAKLAISTPTNAAPAATGNTDNAANSKSDNSKNVVVAAMPEPAPVPAPAVATPPEPLPETAAAPEPPAEPAVMPASLQQAAAPTGHANADNSASAPMDFTGIEPDVVKQSAEAGDKHAQLMLGTMYEDGIGGLPSDLREAAYWYEQAARQGYTKAQYNLGLLYEDGRGVSQNYEQAAYWYEKAAKAGFVEAQNNLGVLYVLGNGVKTDKKKAEKLFSLAAEKGNADAQRNLSMLKGG